jgi:hypothetical protein
VTDKGKDKERQDLSPELKAIEAQLWAAAPPHQRVAALIIGRATGQEELPHILAELRTVPIRDALEARLVGLTFALTHAAVENLSSARVLQPYPDGVADRARLAAVRMTEAACKCVEALAKHKSGGATEHRVTVTHTGPAAEMAVGVRVSQGGDGDGRGDGGRDTGNEHRPHASGTLTHEPSPEMWSPNQGRQAVPASGGKREAPLPDARRGKGQRRA